MFEDQKDTGRFAKDIGDVSGFVRLFYILSKNKIFSQFCENYNTVF